MCNAQAKALAMGCFGVVMTRCCGLTEEGRGSRGSRGSREERVNASSATWSDAPDYRRE